MANIQMLTDYGPLVLVAVAACWGMARIIYLSRREQVKVLSFLARKKTAAENGLALIAVTLDAYLLARPFFREIDVWVFAQPSPLPVFGLILMGLGIGLMIISQIDMGRAWRIGVPQTIEASQTLITSGVYAYSRNPIYVGIMMFLLGTAILLPGPLTLGAVIATFILMQKIILHEETFMESAFGDQYQHYCRHVRRWI